MPREGTETYDDKIIVYFNIMHPMPREGTETSQRIFLKRCRKMHPMPREGTETIFPSDNRRVGSNASYAP